MTLPIQQYREAIVASVATSAVTVITAETGAGKSTQVPQFLLEEGWDLVVTQPRRLAARTLAERVAEERGEAVGEEVGYRTAVDRLDGPGTRCLFVTDGLALVRELMGARSRQVLVLDEVHEWNENVEVLIAWARRQIAEGVEFRLVVMSATLEAEKVAEYFGGAPVISVPGRTFPVTEAPVSGTFEQDIAALAESGKNVLAFLPGKGEISDTMETLQRMGLVAEILPLHGGLEGQEQARCFRSYGRPKVVLATNVAQTSVTIPDIDAVVDSGLERRIELVDGVEGLYLRPISRADREQRKGRAGRTKAGVYIDHCPDPKRRLDWPLAEILRKRLDQTYLRLATAGVWMEELKFFHQPKEAEIEAARGELVALGCLTEDGAVTPIGRRVNRLPVSVQYGRLLVEAEARGVLVDAITVVAILNTGGIAAPGPSRRFPDRPDWRSSVKENQSDPLAQLELWDMAHKLRKSELSERGVHVRNFFRAKELQKRLLNQLRPGPVTGTREDLLKSIVAGLSTGLYSARGRLYTGLTGDRREIGNVSKVSGGEWVVATPFDLDIGGRTVNLLENVTVVPQEWVLEVFGHLIQTEEKQFSYWESPAACKVRRTRNLAGKVLSEEEVLGDPDPARFCEGLLSGASAWTKETWKSGESWEAGLEEWKSARRVAKLFKPDAAVRSYDPRGYLMGYFQGVRTIAEVDPPELPAELQEALEAARWLDKAYRDGHAYHPGCVVKANPMAAAVTVNVSWEGTPPKDPPPVPEGLHVSRWYCYDLNVAADTWTQLRERAVAELAERAPEPVEVEEEVPSPQPVEVREEVPEPIAEEPEVVPDTTTPISADRLETGLAALRAKFG